MVVSGQCNGIVGGGFVAHLETCIPSCLSISSPPFSILLNQLLFTSQGPMDGLGTVQSALCSVVDELKTTQCALSRLAEFQTLTTFYYNCTTSYRLTKFAKIFICSPSIH